MSNSSIHYQSILKSAIIFGGVQAVNILSKVATNKIAALTLGPEGVGFIAIIQNIINVTKTVAGLGISQSAIRDISSAKSKNNEDDLANFIKRTNGLILISAILGFLISTVSSPWVGKYIFDQDMQMMTTFGISLSVLFIILLEGKLAVLRAVRNLSILASATITGSLFGFLVALFGYGVLKEEGIVFVAAMTPAVGLTIAIFCVHRSGIPNSVILNHSDIAGYGGMINSGAVISFATILSQLAALVMTAYISKKGGTYEVGLYTAGNMIVVGYFSAVIGALLTDYYPRIASKSNNNKEINEELNRQTIITTLLCLPLVVLFIFYSNEIILILFSSDFTRAQEFVRVGLMGVIVTIFSNQLDLILIVKSENRLYFVISLLYRVTEVIVSIILYDFYGIQGLGIAMAFLGIVHFSVMYYFTNKLHSVKYEPTALNQLLLLLTIAVMSALISYASHEWYKLIFFIILFSSTILYAYYYAVVKLNLGFPFSIFRK